MNEKKNLYVVIMAGGKGTRFWPRSREKCPKQFLNIVGQKSMLQQTVDRVRPVIDFDKILVVTSQEQSLLVQEQLPDLPASNILVEPMGKNTAPCLGLAAVYISRMEPKSLMCALPADHLIEEEEEFRKILGIAQQFLEGHDYLVTLGIQPTRPETGYGYIQAGEELLSLADKKIFRAARFIEKPEVSVAERLFSSGQYLWNSGMFIWRTNTLLHEIQRHLPNLYQGLEAIGLALGAPKEADVIREVYAELEAVSIDKGVMEKTSRVAVIPGQFGWSDVGSWNSLYDLLPTDASSNIIMGKHQGIESQGCLIFSPDKLVATIGLQNIIIINTEDALLICPKEQGQKIKDLVEKLKQKGLDQYL